MPTRHRYDEDVAVRALVLAGGRGTRLRPLTYSFAKQLIPVANKPIISYVLDDIAGAGITEVAIVIAPETGQEIRDAIGSGGAFGLDITFIEQSEPRGLADAVLCAEEFLRGEPFLMYLGDNLLQEGVADLVAEFERERPNASILLTQVEHPENFGVAVVEGERVVSLVEKPKDPPSNLALVGVYLFDGEIFTAARAIGPSWRGELEITDAIQQLIDRGLDVRSHHTRGWWLDTGKKDDMLDANRTVLASLTPRLDGEVDAASVTVGTVVVEAGAKVVRSRIEGPAIIGAHARVVDSTIGPCTAIGADCVIEDSSVDASIVLTGARVVGVRRLTDSIIGRSAEVVRDTSASGTYRLLIGDDSSVGV